MIVIDDDKPEEETSEVDQQEESKENADVVVNNVSEEAEEKVHDCHDIPMNDNMVYTSQCCNSDRAGSNQPTSTNILNATKQVQGEGRLQQA